MSFGIGLSGFITLPQFVHSIDRIYRGFPSETGLVNEVQSMGVVLYELGSLRQQAASTNDQMGRLRVLETEFPRSLHHLL